MRAEDTCHRLNCRLVELFHDVRLLVTPTTAKLAPVCGSAGNNWVQFTYPFNMTRSPAGTVCAGFTDSGLPIGLQIVGPQHGDLVVLRAMAALEQALSVEQSAPQGLKLGVLGSPNLALRLRAPAELKGPFGIRKTADVVLLQVDDPDGLARALRG